MPRPFRTFAAAAALLFPVAFVGCSENDADDDLAAPAVTTDVDDDVDVDAAGGMDADGEMNDLGDERPSNELDD